jgi:hypothetical protein
VTVKTFAAIVGALIVLLLAYLAYRVVNRWEYQKLGPYAIRRDAFTGAVQIEQNGTYVTSFQNDVYATPLGAEELKRVQIIEPVWDHTGLLCARALVAPGGPIRGRFALHIIIREAGRDKRLRDRSLRVTADWPGGALTPFALRTGLTPPDPQNEKAIIIPQPTTYSGETSAANP